MVFIDEQIQLMRQRLIDQGLVIYAHKAPLEYNIDELTLVKTQDDTLGSNITLKKEYDLQHNHQDQDQDRDQD